MDPAQEHDPKPIPLSELCREAKGIVSSLKSTVMDFGYAIDHTKDAKDIGPAQQYFRKINIKKRSVGDQLTFVEKEVQKQNAKELWAFLRKLWPIIDENTTSDWQMNNIGFHGKKIWVHTDLNVDNKHVKSLPENLLIKGTLRIELSGIKQLPNNLEVTKGIVVNKKQLADAQRLKYAGKISGKIIVA